MAAVLAMAVVASTPPLIFAARLMHIIRQGSGGSKNLAVNTTSSKSASSSLASAKRSAALVSFGVRGFCASMGWFLLTFGLWSNFVPVDQWPINFMWNMVPWPPGGALLLLTLRPVDKVGTIVGTVVFCLILFFFMFSALQFATTPGGPPWLVFMFGPAVCFFAILISTTPNFFCHCYGFTAYVSTPRARLVRLWRSYRIFAVVMAVFFSAIGLAGAGAFGPLPQATNGTSAPVLPGTSPDDPPGAFVTAFLLLCVAVGMRPAVRRKFHARLGGLAARGEARAAAAIAGLVGGRSPEEALKHGTDTFRGLPMTALSEMDFATSGDTGLHAKTLKVSLGEVSAFLSHSWHDDAAAKWQALSTWSSSKANPILWLDKACIDQQKIDESLAALPVYLSGCQDLLIIVGPTYTRRLWCVMELFVFLQMGGELERVSALALPGKEVQHELATFDAAAAQCFKQEDRERLLGIVEAAFGDFNAFNVKVRSIFKKRSATMDKLPSDKEQAEPHGKGAETSMQATQLFAVSLSA